MSDTHTCRVWVATMPGDSEALALSFDRADTLQRAQSAVARMMEDESTSEVAAAQLIIEVASVDVSGTRDGVAGVVGAIMRDLFAALSPEERALVVNTGEARGVAA